MDVVIHPVIRVARAEAACGAGELFRDNSGPWVAKYAGRTWDPENPIDYGNWCAYFVSWCLLQARVVDDLPPRARRGAKALTREVARRGLWVVEPRSVFPPVGHRDPGPGDVVCWHRGLPGSWMGHVGIVADYDPSTDDLVTYEGNAGNFPAAVQRRVYRSGSWRRRLYGVSRIPPDSHRSENEVQ